jgi:hypothetical protein
MNSKNMKLEVLVVPVFDVECSTTQEGSSTTPGPRDG